MKKSMRGSRQRDFGTVRAGRANASVLDRISVDYYGTPHAHSADRGHGFSRSPARWSSSPGTLRP